MVELNSLLNVSADSIKAPPRAPQGTYKALISKYEFGKSAKKSTPLVKFHYTQLQPQADISQDALTVAGQPIDIGKLKLSDDFYLTEDALYRLVEYLKKLGIKTEGRNLGELIPEAVNRPVMFYVTQSPSTKPGSTDVYSEITSYLNSDGSTAAISV